MTRFEDPERPSLPLEGVEMELSAAERERGAERWRDDLLWNAAVAGLQLGPDVEQLERERRLAGARPSALERIEERLWGLGSLGRWASTLALGVVATLALAATTLAAFRLLIAAASALPRFLGDRPLRLHVAWAHVLVMSVLLVLTATHARPGEPEGTIARQAWSQFRRGWALLWCAWLALYGWMGLYWSQEAAGSLSWARWGPPIADLLNVVSAAVFFYLFLILDRPSVKADGQPQRDRAFRRSLFGIAAVCGATATLSILGRFELFGLTSFGPLLGSLLVAISMAFFVGRLSDSHLEVRRALLAPLYFYVAIQVLWHLSVVQRTAGEAADALVLCGALALKVYLFALVTRWVQDGELQRYFDEVAFPRLPSDLE